MNPTAYPLTWPESKPRTPYYNRKESIFGTNSYRAGKKISLSRAIEELLRQLDLLGGVNEIISSNLKLRNDGLPYSQQPRIDDPAIAVYFERYNESTGKFDSLCMSCDRWTKQACNAWSIAKCIEALRGLDRWGGGDMVRAAFTGFKQIAGPAPEVWWSVLDYTSEGEALATDDESFAMRCKKLLQRSHPDKPNGSDWKFSETKEARDTGLRIRANR